MWPTIIISSIIGITVIAIVVKEIMDRINGKSSCSCGCSGCALKDSCHNKK